MQKCRNLTRSTTLLVKECKPVLRNLPLTHADTGSAHVMLPHATCPASERA